MKLYRGLKSSEYKQNSSNKNFQSLWSEILKARELGNFKYLESFNKQVVVWHKNRLPEIHYFTDDKKIAESYIRKSNGVLLKIDLPVKEIIENFTLEIQNYTKRKTKFELVYGIDGDILNKNKENWNMRVL